VARESRRSGDGLEANFSKLIPGMGEMTPKCAEEVREPSAGFGGRWPYIWFPNHPSAVGAL